MTDPALVETYRAAGMEADADSSPAKLHRYVEEELVRFAPVIKAIGFKID